MRQHFKRLLPSQIIFPLVIFFVGLAIAVLNYTPNTFLTGWDTLHPEFNFPHALSSTFWGTFRLDQGLGAIAAHSHMSEIPRIILLWISSIILPPSFLRYFYFFTCLILGPLGMYFFVRLVLSKKDDKLAGSVAAFASALYFLLNLGTLQHFYVPFEMFAAHFAFLPWIFYLALKYLGKGNRRLLLVIFIVTFLGSPQAYAATLFYGFFVCFASFIFLYSTLTKSIRRGILVLFTLIFASAFWMLPNFYSALNQSAEIEQSKINSLFSPEAILHNQQWGTLDNIFLNKNFLFDWREYSFAKGEFVQVLNEWQLHLENPVIAVLGWVTVVIALLGLIGVVVRKDKVGISLLLPFVICLFFLINNNPPTGFLYRFFTENFPVLGEAFRTPFTKFSIFFILIMGYFFGSGIYLLIKGLFRIKKTVIIPVVLAGLVAVLLGIYMLPAFKGNLISRSMRVSIPQEYFDMYEWFDNQPDQRVATLPMYTFWGWKYLTWGYQGAGFLWFGLNQPVMERDFDRWNADNETFYTQASSAIYEENQENFENILAKYNIGYLVYDSSEFNPGGSSTLLKSDLLEKWLNNSPNITKEKDFGFISVYKTPWGREGLVAPSQYQYIDKDSTYAAHDSLNYKDSIYIRSDKANMYPFANLDPRVTQKAISDNKIILSKNVDLDGKYTLSIPDLTTNQTQVVVSAYGQFVGGDLEVTLILQPPKIIVDGIETPLDPVKYSYKFDLDEPAGYLSVGNKVYPLNYSLSSSNVYLGTQVVNTNQDTPLAVYGQNLIIDEEFGDKLLSSEASWCSDSTKKVPSRVSRKILTLVAQKESVCVGNGAIMPTNGLNSLKFVSGGEMYPFACLNSATSNGCLNTNKPNQFQDFSGFGRESLFLTPLTKGDYWQAFVAQGQDKGQKSLELSNFQSGYYPEIGRLNATLGESFGVFYRDKNIELDSPKEISIELPILVSATENFGLNRGYPQTKNCDLDERGEVSRIRNQDSVEYYSVDDGIACDYFDYPEVSFPQGYFFRMTGVNSLGRPIKIYLQNQGENRIQEEILLSESNFDDLYYLPSLNIDKSGGYVANIENRSFGWIEAKNLINNIEFIFVPDQWLGNIFLTPSANAKLDIQDNPVKILNQSKTGLIYKTQIDASKGDGVVVLPVEYEKGWVALGLKDLEINTWANGWEVPQGTKNITVFYLPQILQFGGFIIAFLWLIIVILYPRVFDKRRSI